MYEYVSITLNLIECAYTCIHLKRQSAEYATIQNVSDAVHRIRSLYKLLSSYRNTRIQNIVKHLRWSVLQKKKRKCPSAGAQPEIFLVKRWGSFVELGHFNIDFVKNTSKRSPAVKHSGLFSPRYF